MTTAIVQISKTKLYLAWLEIEAGQTTHKTASGKDVTVNRDKDGRFATSPDSKDSGSQETKENRIIREYATAKTEEQVNEAITKRVIYRPPAEFMGKKEPGRLTQESVKFLKKHNYEIEIVLDDPETGFTAFALKSKDPGKTMLAFTGSNDVNDWRNNVLGEVGRVQFEANKKDIEKAIKKLKQETGEDKIQLSGHSLGGALAQITASEFPEDVSVVRTYNSPKVDITTAIKFITTTEAKKQERPKVVHYVKEGDIVSVLGGVSLLPGDIKYYKTGDNPTKSIGFYDHMSLVTQEGKLSPAPDSVNRPTKIADILHSKFNDQVA